MIIAVTTILPARHDGFIWFPFEPENCSTIEDVSRRLADDGHLYGQRLETTVKGGKRVVTKRLPHIVGVGGIVTISPLHIDLIDEAGASS